LVRPIRRSCGAWVIGAFLVVVAAQNPPSFESKNKLRIQKFEEKFDCGTPQPAVMDF
jgi:hypothetical protein